MPCSNAGLFLCNQVKRKCEKNLVNGRCPLPDEDYISPNITNTNN